ncbi:hypothetical protein [Alienimonas sp. DA493]|uniref:hypothetical protein n=1 Tax=Alienimonas sp. DA493 TaxID=3373605 RepID=UPI0037544512
MADEPAAEVPPVEFADLAKGQRFTLRRKEYKKHSDAVPATETEDAKPALCENRHGDLVPIHPPTLVVAAADVKAVKKDAKPKAGNDADGGG